MKPQMFETKIWIGEVDPVVLKEFFDNALFQSGFTILRYSDYLFVPDRKDYAEGWTALWLLGESHFAIHTFPICELNDSNTSYIYLASCVEEYYHNFVHFLHEHKDEIKLS